MKNQNIFEPLFSFDNDYRNNACINSYSEPMSLYSAGYREAAKKLIEQVLEESGPIDILVYPIIFFCTGNI